MNSREEPSEPATAGGAEPEQCPRCGAVLIPVAYGYPSMEMFEAAERGEILLGGCVLFEGRPTSRCPECGAGIGSLSLPEETEHD